MDGYSQWMVIPNGWFFRKDGHSEWMVLPNARLFRMDGFSEWMASPRGHYYAFLVQPTRIPELPKRPREYHKEANSFKMVQIVSSKKKRSPNCIGAVVSNVPEAVGGF